MKRTTTLEVVFFKEPETENQPVKEWIKKLDKDDQKIIGHDLWFLQENWPIGKPYVDNLAKNLWELRSKLNNRIARVIFSVKYMQTI